MSSIPEIAGSILVVVGVATTAQKSWELLKDQLPDAQLKALDILYKKTQDELDNAMDNGVILEPGLSQKFEDQLARARVYSARGVVQQVGEYSKGLTGEIKALYYELEEARIMILDASNAGTQALMDAGEYHPRLRSPAERVDNEANRRTRASGGLDGFDSLTV